MPLSALSVLWSLLLSGLSLEGGVLALRRPPVQSFALSSFAINETQNDLIPMENVKTVVYSRMDPIVRPGIVSNHIHIVVGGTAFGPNLPYEAATASQCTTMPITNDKSSYWAPTLHYQWENKTWSALEGVTNITYLLRPPSVDNPSLQEFPEGFAFFGGFSARWNRTRPAMDSVIWYECTPSNGEPVAASWEIPDQQCSSITTVVNFPWCWTGKDLRTGGNNTHVSYPNGTGDDWVNCNDPKFPVRLPRIEHRVSYDLTRFPFRPESLAISNGDKIGYSLHADFVNGWPKGYLVDVFETRSACRASLASGGNGTACSVGLKGVDLNAASACQQDLPLATIVNERTGLIGTIEKLPGCVSEPHLVGVNPLCTDPLYTAVPTPGLVAPVARFGEEQFPISPVDRAALSGDSGGSSNVAIIVPCVIGGVFVVALSCGFTFWCLRQQRLQQHRTLTTDVPEMSQSSPSREKAANGSGRPSLVSSSFVGGSRDDSNSQTVPVKPPLVGTSGTPSTVSSGAGTTAYSDAPSFSSSLSQSPGVASPSETADQDELTYSRGLSAINERPSAAVNDTYQSPLTSADSSHSPTQRSPYGPGPTQAIWGPGGMARGKAGRGGAVSQERSYVGEDRRMPRDVVTSTGAGR